MTKSQPNPMPNPMPNPWPAPAPTPAHTPAHAAPHTPAHTRLAGRLRSGSALAGGTALAGGLAGLMLLAAPAQTQGQTQVQPQVQTRVQTRAAGGTLGIACEAPRRTAEGKLILGDHSGWRLLCEVDREMALHYAQQVELARDRLRHALDSLPAPLWGDLLAHLRDTDSLAGWSYTDPAILDGLQRLDADLHSIAQTWQGGILSANDWSTGLPPPAGWHPLLRARACGVDRDGRVEIGAELLVWLDPAALRSRWRPDMVQRAVRAWLERQSDPFVVRDRIPGRVTAPTSTTRALTGPEGRVRALHACFADVPEGALAMRLSLGDPLVTGRRIAADCGPGRVGARRYMWARRNGVFLVPEGALARDGTVRADRGTPLLGQGTQPLRGVGLGAEVEDTADVWFLVHDRCRAPRLRDIDRVIDCPGTLNGQPVTGALLRTLRFRERQEDPVDPFRIDLIPIAPRGGAGTGSKDFTGPDAAWVDVPPGSPHTVWRETVMFCTGPLPGSGAPILPRPVETQFPIPDCATQWGGRFNEGGRTGYHQVITYPPGWPVRPVEVRHIEDDCFARDPQSETRTETRPGPACPAGHTGAITEHRILRYDWFHRRFAITRGRDAGATHADWQRVLPDRASFAEALAHYRAGNVAGPSGVFDRVTVTLARDWSAASHTCRPLAEAEDDTRGDEADETRANRNGADRNGANRNGNGDVEEDPSSIDVDGDGRGDFSNRHDARRAGFSGGREVPTRCGACNGPQRGSEADKDDDDTAGDDGDSGGGGGCFLTTAIVERRGEADDGPTLTALRAFRDGWMARHPDGPALVRAYYDLAPRIIAALPDTHPDWDWIGEQVDRAVACLTRQDPEGAFTVYTAMVRRLTATWLAQERATPHTERTRTCA